MPWGNIFKLRAKFLKIMVKKKKQRKEERALDAESVEDVSLKAVEKLEKVEKHERPAKPDVKALFANEQVITEDSDSGRELYNQSRFGTLSQEGKVQLSLIEAIYLLEKHKIEVYDSRNKVISFDDFLKKARKVEPNVWVRYSVYKDMRNRGYIVKTALKFGADFRVYDRGVKPGEDHARWILYPVHEGNVFSWYEFAAKNRVAHSTRKRLLMGIVDDEHDVTYYEIAWKRP
jgi:tRNA-intron endonuclease